jgi:tape measure domain-containing protein
VNIASLFASLGIDLDAGSFAAADAKLQALRARAEEVMQRVRSNTEHFDEVILNIGRQVRAAAGGVDDAVLDWTDTTKKGINWTKAWEKAVGGVTTAYKFARKAVIGITVGGAILKGLGHLADAYTGARSRINQLTDSTEQQVRLQDTLFASAQNTATAYDAVVELYQQVGTAAKANGRSLEQGAVLVDTINKAIKASGASADGATQALRQLGQGLGSGVLRGEEYNAVLEQAPVLIDLIGASIGKTRGEMRKMADSGQITSKMILRALDQQKGAVDAAYAKRLPQVGDLFVRLRNTISKALSEVFQKKEVIAGLTTAFKALTAVLIATIQLVAGVALALARHPGLVKAIIVVLTGLTAAFIAMKVQAAIAWLTALGPIALIVAGVIGLIAVIVLFHKQFGKAISAIGKAWDGFWRSIDHKLRSFLRGIKSFFSDIGSYIKSIFVDIVNGVIDGINKGVWVLNKAIRLANRIPGIDLGTVSEIDHIGETRGGALSTAAVARVTALANAASAGSRPSTKLPTRPIATMPSVRSRRTTKQVNVNNNGPVTIQVNGARDEKATAAEVARQLKLLRDQDMHAAMAGLDEGDDEQ